MNKVKNGLILVLLVLIDQISKYIIVKKYDIGEGIEIIKNVLHIEYVQNTGAAWGMMPNGTLFFAIFASIVVTILIIVVGRIPNESKYIKLSYTMIFLIAGAVGNLIDRIFRKYVVDFIYFKAIEFPVFNIADIYITLSGILLVILILFYYKDDDFEFLKIKNNK